MINELNLSYQKAHRDYANASQEQQKTFILTGLTQDHYNIVISNYMGKLFLLKRGL